MKKLLLLILVMICAQVPVAMKAINLRENFSMVITKYGQPLCKRLMDVGASYLLATGIVMTHEIGHALTAKMFYGLPCDITICMLPCRSEKFHFKLGCFDFRSVAPPFGWAQYGIHAASPLKEATICLAGPAFGTIASLLAYGLLKKIAPKFHVTKGMALFGLFGNTVGQAAIALKNPWTDFACASHHLKEFFKGTKKP